jgi:hypothetical protein
MHGENTAVSAALFDPDQGVTGQPVVCVNDVESSDVALGFEHVVNEGPAHIVDFIDEVWMEVKRATMVVDAVDSLVPVLAVSHPGKYVYFVTSALECGSQFGDMYANTTDTY